MSAGSIAILLVFALGAAFIQRVTGFGFGIFIMTVLPYIMPSYGESTALSGLLALITVTITGVQLIRAVPWKKLLPLLLTFILVSAVAIHFVSRIDSHMMRRVLGVILIAVSVWFFFISDRIRVRPTMPVQVGLGTAAGLMGGFFAMQGPPAVIYFLACTDTKQEYTAISSWFFIIGNLMMTGFRAANGFVTSAVGIAWAVALPAVLLGFHLGTKVYDRLPIQTIRKVVYAYMAFSGLLALVS